MAFGDAPENIYRFPVHRARAGARVGIRVTGLDPDQNRNLPERERYPISNERRNEIINFHLAAINSIRAAKGLPALAGADLNKVLAAAYQTDNPSSESIMQAVIAAASAALPDNTKQAFLDNLKAQGVTEEQYNTALARYGTFPSLEAAIFAARSVGNGGTVGSIDNTTTASNGSYPNYGGTPFRDYGSYASYGHSTYGFNAATSQQLWGLGVHTREQMQQVVNDVGRIGLGAGKENPHFTNKVAPHVARLRIHEGADTDRHLDHARRHAEEYRRIKKARLDAEKRGDATAMAEADRQLAELHKQREQYNRDQVRTPEGRTAHDKIVTETENEVRRQLRLQHGNHPSLGDNYDAEAIRRAYEAQRNRIGQGHDVAAIEKLKSEVEAEQRRILAERHRLHPELAGHFTPSARPEVLAERRGVPTTATPSATPTLSAVERREIATVQSALDEFGAVPSATVRADAPLATPSSTVAAGTPTGTPSATAVAQNTAGTPSGSPSATVVAQSTATATASTAAAADKKPNQQVAARVVPAGPKPT
ncbi:MAG: hypothetical protein SFW65_04590 [Alphaproteobacteria bacterium]|nr:hypothetical protein [Alphaproteobacteria bacterium]